MYKIATLVVLLGLTAQPALALNVTTGVDASIKAGTNAGASTSIESDTAVKSDTDATAASETAADISIGDVITITARDVESDTGVAVRSSNDVDTKTELDSYARGVVKTNADIRDVVLSETEVAVSHKQSARLFGILPIKVYARTQVESDGTVAVKFPWYAFASAKKAAIESRVATAVRASLPNVSADASAKLSAQTQAEILEKTVAAMQAEALADAQVDVQ
jgi:hypothetical protein